MSNRNATIVAVKSKRLRLPDISTSRPSGATARRGREDFIVARGTTDALSAVALDRDAGIVAWGFNANGELGHDSGTSSDFFDGGAWQNFVPLPVSGLP
jgi:hypothetical protein